MPSNSWIVDTDLGLPIGLTNQAIAFFSMGRFDSEEEMKALGYGIKIMLSNYVINKASDEKLVEWCRWVARHAKELDAEFTLSEAGGDPQYTPNDDLRLIVNSQVTSSRAKRRALTEALHRVQRGQAGSLLQEWAFQKIEDLGLDIEDLRPQAPREREERPQLNQQDRRGFIYLLYGGGYYKIGMTAREVDKRIAEFSPRLPFEIEIAYSIQVEDAPAAEEHLHKRFASKHTNGEWFELSDEDVAWIKGWDGSAESGGAA